MTPASRPPFPSVFTSIHCAKAFKRSGLWEPSRWPDRSDLPSIAQILVDQLHTPGLTADAIGRTLQESYKTTLY